jgi:hypothetical protein
METHEETLRQVNRSGFPFQLRVEHEITDTVSQHNWEVASREHPWVNNAGAQSGYIDLVLKHLQFSTFRLVIECKRIKANDARQLRWVFLVPDKDYNPSALASCFEVEGSGKKDLPTVSSWSELRVWDNVYVSPASLQSGICILQNDDQRRQPILETLAGEVLESIEGIAQEEINVERSLNGNLHARLFIFPAIVTNAELAVCRYDPAKIDIKDGTLNISDLEIATVPFIRFRKSLATAFPEGMFYYLDAANRARERTVFVVDAACITEFLKDWKMTPLPNRDYAIRRLLQS